MVIFGILIIERELLLTSFFSAFVNDSYFWDFVWETIIPSGCQASIKSSNP